MQLESFEVKKLFGRFDHRVPFPTRPEADGASGADSEVAPSLAILYGLNGIGKTTVLRMLAGMMEKDFTSFRRVPFVSCQLRFSTGEVLAVAPIDIGAEKPLEVTFEDISVLLHPLKSGPYREEQAGDVLAFREFFDERTAGVNVDFIETSRVQAPPDPDTDAEYEMVEGQVVRRRAKKRPEAVLGRRVARFIREAQVDHRRFFARTEPELFPRIMQRLTSDDPPAYEPEELGAVLRRVKDQTEESERLGLGVEPWDYEELMGYLGGLDSAARDDRALTVLGAYTEFLESRSAQRHLLTQRLRRFEDILEEFYQDKQVRVSARHGLEITTENGDRLTEDQLSSGEQHLLYLMVSALTTHRRGTVIAIDEPELSMHIGWQRMLIQNLLDCASNASPQLVIATHSPEIVADYKDSLVPLKRSRA